MFDEEKRAVLIVDDQDNWRTFLAEILLDEYQVTTAADYNGALKALDYQNPPFHVAVVDIRLDDADVANEQGLNLISVLKARRGLTNSIVLTGYPTVRTVKKALRDLQAFDYFEKVPEDGAGFNLAGFRRSVRRAADDIGVRQAQKEV
jgi:DNA-binding NtrC family response regulator